MVAMKTDELYDHFAGCALIASSQLLTWERMIAFSEDKEQAHKMALAVWEVAAAMIRAKPKAGPLPSPFRDESDEDQP